MKFQIYRTTKEKIRIEKSKLSKNQRSYELYLFIWNLCALTFPIRFAGEEGERHGRTGNIRTCRSQSKLGSMADLFLLKPKSMEDETQIRRLCEESVEGCQQPLNWRMNTGMDDGKREVESERQLGAKSWK